MGLLKFLLVAISILWLIRIVVRLLLPWAVRKMAQKVMGNAQQHQYRYDSGPSMRPEEPRQRRSDSGVRIDYVPPQGKPRRGAQTAGEFVDFEEIKPSAD